MRKTAYEVRISDWSSDLCSSDLLPGGLLLDEPLTTPGERRPHLAAEAGVAHRLGLVGHQLAVEPRGAVGCDLLVERQRRERLDDHWRRACPRSLEIRRPFQVVGCDDPGAFRLPLDEAAEAAPGLERSEEHTSALQSLMR